MAQSSVLKRAAMITALKQRGKVNFDQIGELVSKDLVMGIDGAQLI